MVHEVGQVDGPHALRQLQLPAGRLEVLVTDGMEVPAGGRREVKGLGVMTFTGQKWPITSVQLQECQH